MDSIEEIWNKGNEQLLKDETFSVEFIKKAISESSTSISAKFVKMIWMPIIITFLAIIMFVYNIFFYLNNTPILLTIIALIILSISIIIFLFIQKEEIIEIDKKNTDLRNLLVSKIVHYNSKFQYVFHCYALSIVLATMTINLTIENADGIFALHKILILLVYYIAVYIGTIYLFKTVNGIYIKRLKNALYNLEENTFNLIDEEEKMHKRNRKRIFIIAVIVLVIGLVAAFVKAGILSV